MPNPTVTVRVDGTDIFRRFAHRLEERLEGVDLCPGCAKALNGALEGAVEDADGDALRARRLERLTGTKDRGLPEGVA